VRHHEDSFLLGVEIIHKVLRRDTAYTVMDKIRQGGGDFQVWRVKKISLYSYF